MSLDKELAKDLKPGEFLIGDYSSRDLKSLIENRPLIQKAKRKGTEKNVSFRSGTLWFDEKAYEDFPLSLDLFCKAKNEEERDYLRDLITIAFDSSGYQPFIPYFDKSKIYYVRTTGGPDFQGDRALHHSERYTLSFTVKPFKRLIESGEVSLTNGQILINPSFYPSNPLITIQGRGDVTLRVNEEDFVIRDIQDSIIINSTIPSAYRINNGVVVNEENKVYTKAYPILKSGENVIQWTGNNVSEVKVETRWQTR